MAEDMVPTGGAYGDRATTVAGMQAANIPLSSSPPPPQQVGTGGPVGSQIPSGSLPPSPMSPMDLLSGNTPDAFPWLVDAAQPVPAPTEAGSTLNALAASTQSSFGAAVLALLNQAR